MPLCRLLTGWGAAGRGGGTVCCRIWGSAHPQRRCAKRCAEQETPFGPGAVCLSAVLSCFGFCFPLRLWVALSQVGVCKKPVLRLSDEGRESQR